MEVFLASAVVFVLAMLGMSIGTIFGNRPLKGSCGDTCGHCGHTPQHGCQDGQGAHHACQHEQQVIILGDKPR